MTSPKIYKSNALIEASYTLTVAEQRIILACIAQVDRGQPITDNVMYSVPIAEIAKAIGTDRGSMYVELFEAALKLRNRAVHIEMEPNGGGRKAKKLITSWVQTIAYNERQGVIELRFNTDMLPYLTELKEQFTRYSLSDVAKMTSIYAIRLFEMLIQYTTLGTREIALNDLRNWFQLNDKYALMADLRRFVIEPAVHQINECSPLQVQYEPKRTGRKITHLNFIIRNKKAAAAPFALEAPPSATDKPKRNAKRIGISQYELSKAARPGESYDEALARLNARLVP